MKIHLLFCCKNLLLNQNTIFDIIRLSTLINLIMKTYYFAEVNPEDFELTDKDELFFNNGRYYWMALTLEEDQVLIRDTCDRHMPIGLDQIHKFSELIRTIAEMEVVKIQAQDRIDQLMYQMDMF